MKLQETDFQTNLNYLLTLCLCTGLIFSCTEKKQQSLAGTEPPGSAIASMVLDDGNIEAAIERELALQRGVFGHIGVACSEGIVTLTGETNNILTKERAAQIAQMIKGVRGVINRINLNVGEVTDQEINEQLDLALYWDPALEKHEIKAEVREGIVDLYGDVDSWAEKQLAGKVAKSVRGVKNLNNNIVFRFTEERNDSELAEEILQNLRWDVLVDDALIEVIVSDGKVTLTGTVGSLAEKSQAKTNAWVAGVDSVDVSQLEVERWARDSDLRADKYAQKSDEEIGRAVRAAFLQDPRISTYQPEIEVLEGVVTLSGKANSLQAKQAAESNSWAVVGVVRVNNQLTVEPITERSDQEIEGRINNAIAWDPVLEDYQVSLAVNDGTVVLEGEVDSYYEKYKAAEVAARTLGVTQVSNQLKVTTWTPYHYDYDYYYYHHMPAVPQVPVLSDQEIQDAIEAHFYWSPFINEDEITISVLEGKATLSGTVDSWEEKRQAEQEAFDGGAVTVENHIVVRYSSPNS